VLDRATLFQAHRQVLKDVAEMPIGLEPIGLGSLIDEVPASSCLAPGLALAEQSGTAPDGNRPDVMLGKIVVQAQGRSSIKRIN